MSSLHLLVLWLRGQETMEAVEDLEIKVASVSGEFMLCFKINEVFKCYNEYLRSERERVCGADRNCGNSKVTNESVV